MKIIKLIRNITTIILISLFIFSLTIFIYYNINKEDLEDFICPNFIKIESIESINNFTKRQRTSFKHSSQLLKTVRLLTRFKEQEKNIFQGITSLFNSQGKNITLPQNRELLIVDTGWHSLLISTSFLAIKSIYSENKNYIISDKKLTIKNRKIKLYKISFKNSHKNIFLIINKNLVFISQSQKAILSSFHCLGDYNKNKMHNYNIMLSKNRTKQLFSSLFDTPFSNFKKDSDYSIWSANQQKKGIRLNGEIRIIKSQKKSSSKYQRILDSNQYRFQGYKIIPNTFTEAFILLFDDMEEIYNIVSNKKIANKEKLLTKKCFRWTANELGLFRNNNNNFLFIRAADIKKLKKQINLLIKFKNSKKKKNLIMPVFIQNLRKAFHLKKSFRNYTIINCYLIFAENSKHLKDFKKMIANKNTISKMDSTLLHHGKGDKNNFIFIWKTRQPRIPMIKKISKLVKRNIGYLTGTIQGSFHKDSIEINGMLR